MQNLRKLQLTSRKLVTLSGIENLVSLSSLDLAGCSKLMSIAGVEKCQELHTVEIESCKKLNDISSLSELRSLQNVMLTDCGKIKSLRPLVNCQQLENLTFVGDTSIEDGELTSLLDISTLKKMWFANRRHYSHNREQITEVLSG